MASDAIDLVVVSYKSPGDLTKFASSVIQVVDEVPLTVVIVDVQATEEEQKFGEALTAELCDAGVMTVYYPTKSNTGYGLGCNLGAKVLPDFFRSDTVVFLNADTELRPGVLASCRDLLWSDPAIAVVGPRQIDERGRLTHAGIIGTLDKPRFRGWLQPGKERYGDVIDVVTVAGSAYFMKRAVFDELADCDIYRELCPTASGAFLQTPLFYEETWVSYHAQAHNYRIVYNGEATMVHRHHGAINEHGGDHWFKPSKVIFVAACLSHGILHD